MRVLYVCVRVRVCFTLRLKCEDFGLQTPAQNHAKLMRERRAIVTVLTMIKMGWREKLRGIGTKAKRRARVGKAAQGCGLRNLAAAGACLFWRGVAVEMTWWCSRPDVWVWQENLAARG